MYTITLEVNQICNLRCNYCYLGEKTNENMLEQKAYKGLEIAFLNVEKHKDRRLWVDFVGGEALLSFNLLKTLVEYIEWRAKKNKVMVSYSITTNGSIMNDEILTWLIKNKIHLKLSIDGSAKTHDKNRKTNDGTGSYELIMKNIPYFREYEDQSKQFIQAAHVVTRNNYWEAFEAVKHLVEDLKFRVVDSSIDVLHRWSTKDLDCLANEWEKIACFYIRRKNEGKEFLWGPILDFQKYGQREKELGYCGVGLIQIYVKVDGRIFGCAANLETSGCLGDVDRGLSVALIKKYRELTLNEGMCLKCKVRENCQSRMCIMNSLKYSGRIDGHNPDICYF